MVGQDVKLEVLCSIYHKFSATKKKNNNNLPHIFFLILKNSLFNPSESFKQNFSKIKDLYNLEILKEIYIELNNA